MQYDKHNNRKAKIPHYIIVQCYTYFPVILPLHVFLKNILYTFNNTYVLMQTLNVLVLKNKYFFYNMKNRNISYYPVDYVHVCVLKYE